MIHEQHAMQGLTLMAPQTLNFPWGIVSLDDAPRDVTMSSFRASSWTMFCDGAVVTLTFHRSLPATARETVADAVGRALSAPARLKRPLPLAILIGLAMIAVHGTFPGSEALQAAHGIARVMPWHERSSIPPQPMPLREVRRMITDEPTLSSSTVPALPLRVGGTAWDWARAWTLLGDALWLRLAERDSARLMGRIAVTSNLTHHHLALGLAPVLAHPRRWRSLPAPIAGNARISDIWLDWASVAAGPTTPDPLLWTHGVGDALDHPLQTSDHHRALPLDDADRLIGVATDVLADRDRPMPRLIGQIVRVPLPTDLLPVWTTWDIDALVVQIHHEGMFLSLRTPEDRTAAVAWWDAHPESGRWTPLVIPTAAWVLVHATAAAIWHDLCADAIAIAAGNSGSGRLRHPSQAPAASRHPSSRPTPVMCPPRRRVLAVGAWGDAGEHEHIRSAVA